MIACRPSQASETWCFSESANNSLYSFSWRLTVTRCFAVTDPPRDWGPANAAKCSNMLHHSCHHMVGQALAVGWHRKCLRLPIRARLRSSALGGPLRRLALPHLGRPARGSLRRCGRTRAEAMQLCTVALRRPVPDTTHRRRAGGARSGKRHPAGPGMAAGVCRDGAALGHGRCHGCVADHAVPPAEV